MHSSCDNRTPCLILVAIQAIYSPRPGYWKPKNISAIQTLNVDLTRKRPNIHGYLYSVSLPTNCLSLAFQIEMHHTSRKVIAGEGRFNLAGVPSAVHKTHGWQLTKIRGGLAMKSAAQSWAEGYAKSTRLIPDTIVPRALGFPGTPDSYCRSG